MKKLSTETHDLKECNEQLEKLKISNISDRQIALTNLTTNLKDKHQKELDSLKSSHKTELQNLGISHRAETSKSKSAHDAEVYRLSGLPFAQELRTIKANFEKEKQDAIDRAVEIEQLSHSKEVANLKRQLSIEKRNVRELEEQLKSKPEKLSQIKVGIMNKELQDLTNKPVK